MEFEWDEAKNKENQKKHGVAFPVAVSLWNETHVEIENLAYSEEGETRSAMMGWIANKVYVAIWTRRDGKIRLISVRRARKNEEKIFFEKIQN